MRTYPTMPHDRVKGWPSEVVPHPPNSEHVDLHYHDVEEWLEVMEGTVTFFTAGGATPHSLAAGNALNIDPGEVHRVKIGQKGVTYRMWLPRDMQAKTFRHPLDGPDKDLVQRNLELPVFENHWDARGPDDTIAGHPAGRFLDDFTSDDLVFRNVGGVYLGKHAYLARRPPDPPLTRKKSDTVSVLHKDAGSILLSTIVETELTETGKRGFTANVRFFVKEDGAWKCRIWVNHPEPERP